MGGGVWYLTATTPPEVQAGAWDFMKYVNTIDSQRLWHVEGSYLPSRSDAPEDAQIEEFWTTTRPGDWLSQAYGLLEGLNPEFPGPLIGPYRQVREAVGEALDGMFFGDLTPEEAVAQVDEEINAAIERYNEVNF